MNILQDPGEKPSTYLHRLQLALNLALRRGGAAPAEVDKHLLKQFYRGRWDNSLLSALQIEQKKSNPPSFADLLLLLRTEEDRQLAKASRMKKHIGPTRQRGQLQLQSAWACGESKEKSEVSLSVIEDLGRQIASLQSQLTYFMAQKKTKGTDNRGAAGKSPGKVQNLVSANTDMLKQTKKKQTSRPRPWYCFNCGEDGHIAPVCTDKANPALVAEKRKQLEEKQHRWETQNSLTLPLND
ncbi:zinc finger CCHC domain-containing protein 12-like [Tachysurus fulvidraco]|uniref:zinc finger CCHC domain-containing protein 12-like n=1 Tax=Tachysurus fulvidraco TaxID=1234273 RepID=UPI001FEE9F9B|nr:zinc finger CCHC domain-containing protein 12-like [Tachysurus fulvidraco]